MTYAYQVKMWSAAAPLILTAALTCVMETSLAARNSASSAFGLLFSTNTDTFDQHQVKFAKQVQPWINGTYVSKVIKICH